MSTTFTLHGWTWTVPGSPARCIVPAHTSVVPQQGGWMSGPGIISIANGEGVFEMPLFTDATLEEAALPWADCPEARTALSRACDTPAHSRKAAEWAAWLKERGLP